MASELRAYGFAVVLGQTTTMSPTTETSGMSTWVPQPSGPPSISPAPLEEAAARKARKLVVAGLITSAGSLLFCPYVGSLAGAGLAFAGQQITPAGRRSPLGKLPLVTYVLSVLGVVGWTAILSISAATAPRKDEATKATLPSTTQTSVIATTQATAPANPPPPASTPAESAPPPPAAVPPLPTTQPPPPASLPPSTEPVLPGFGATRASWDAAHQDAGGRFTRGSAYGPRLAGSQPTYAGVVGDDRIISYDLYMAPGTSIEAATQRVRQEFPSDAQPGPVRRGSGCRLQEIRSPSVERVLNGSAAIVAYSDNDPTIPADRRFVVATIVLHMPGDQAEC